MQTLLLKVARSGEDGEKVLVLVEAGVRFHATQYARDKSLLPASFCVKLRKHLRGKRVADVAQLGVDRIVVFTFGGGEGEHHLLLELYASVRGAYNPGRIVHLSTRIGSMKCYLTSFECFYLRIPCSRALSVSDFCLLYPLSFLGSGGVPLFLPLQMHFVFSAVQDY